VPFQKITPNLVVRDVAASLRFYEQTLGLQRRVTVPDREPYIFVSVVSGSIEIFLNQDEARTRRPAGSMSLYIEMSGLDQLLDRIKQHSITIEVPLNETFYGMREFAILDPDGYMIIFAEPAKR
jgi:uncharacterized glyoxalase superfamily protein PhnB